MDYDVYEAHVDITPIISRVEIKSLGCVFNKQDEGTAGTPTEHLYTSVTVKGIGMVDYYNMGILGKLIILRCDQYCIKSRRFDLRS